MPEQLDLKLFLLIALWLLSSLVAGVVLALMWRRRLADGLPAGDNPESAREREATLKTLVEMLKSVEQLTSEVGSHNTEIREVGRHVGELKVSGELEDIQHAIIGHIGSVLKSNQKLADELVVAHYQMEMQAQEIDRTRREARTDPLADIGNRKAFDEALQWLITTWKRDREPFVLILADIDRFKWVNDTHGHQAGDRVLTQMGALLKLCVRGGDIVTRYGGDEFAMLLPRTDLVQGSQVAARLRLHVWRSTFHMSERGEQGVISLSIGVTAARDEDTLETLMARADRALYHAKEMGRNRVYCLSGVEREPQQVELVGTA